MSRSLSCSPRAVAGPPALRGVMTVCAGCAFSLTYSPF